MVLSSEACSTYETVTCSQSIHCLGVQFVMSVGIRQPHLVVAAQPFLFRLILQLLDVLLTLLQLYLSHLHNSFEINCMQVFTVLFAL